MSEQIPLAVTLRDDVTFDNFHATGKTLIVKQCLQKALADGESLIYLWGEASSGKTHLLQASCHALPSERGRASYLPLKQSLLAPAVLQSLEHLPLVCLDDIHSVMGDAGWEEALFHFYNRAQEQGSTLIVSANTSPRALPCHLADLQSRLSSGVCFELPEMAEHDKAHVLCQRAARLGCDISQDVALFLMRRYSEDLAHLTALIKHLDRAALTAQRRLTIPFIRTVLALDA